MPSGTSRPRLFLDANVLFSAAYDAGGRSAALFELARKGRCRLLSSAHAIAEAERNLRIKRPQLMKEFLDIVAALAVVPEGDARSRERAADSGLDSGDAPVLAAAAGRADFLVTGDRRHFGRWMGKDLLGVRVLSLAGALDLLLPK